MIGFLSQKKPKEVDKILMSGAMFPKLKGIEGYMQKKFSESELKKIKVI